MPTDSSSQTSAAITPDIEISQRMSVGRAALMLSLMIALSRVIGFGRTILTSHLYGQSDITDAYYAAFNIPDTISTLIAGGALATGFVPVFTEYLTQGKQAEAARTFRSVLTFLTLAFGGLTLLLFAWTWTPWSHSLVSDKAQTQTELYLYLLRVLLIAQFFFVVGGLFSGTLNALRLFWYSALQPVVFNLGILVFGLVLPHFSDLGIRSQAWGALFGAVVGSILIQLPAIRRNGLSIQPLLDWNDKGMRRVLGALLPVVFGLASGQIIALNLPRYLAYNFLAQGDTSALDNANRLMQVPLDLLASGPAVALFPTLLMLATRGEIGDVRTHLVNGLRRTMTLVFVAAALLMALREPILKLLLEHGAFKASATEMTSRILFCYGLCLPGLAAQQVLARGFYAMKDARTPVVIGLGATAIFGVLGALVLRATSWGAAGLALAAALATAILGAAMWFSLKQKLGGWDNDNRSTPLIFLKATVCALLVYCVANAVSVFGLQQITGRGWDDNLTPSLMKIAARSAVFLSGTLAGIAIFLLGAKLLKLPLRTAQK